MHNMSKWLMSYANCEGPDQLTHIDKMDIKLTVFAKTYVLGTN